VVRHQVGQALNAAVQTFLVRPSWHLARVAQWATRLTRGRLGTRRQAATDALLGSRQRALRSERSDPSDPAFVDTQADWQKL
jgi:hypothetical protein